MRVLVCGGRDNWDHEGVARELNLLRDKHEDAIEGIVNQLRPRFTVITGGAPGIDNVALQYCMREKVRFELYEAEWKKHGRRAGPMRNLRMIVEGKPNLVLAFKGGRGTADLIRQAKQYEIEVIEVK